MDYKFLPSNVSPNNIVAYSKLLSAVFGESTSKFTVAFLTWQYVQNPMGTVVGTDAFYNGVLVAHHATIPVQYNISGRPARGLLALNNATHPEHQGKGLFTKIGKMTMEKARLEGFEFVISASNQNSTYGYIHKFGFTLITQLMVKVGLGKIIPDNPENYPVHAVWNEALLRWRLQNPEAKYFKKGNTIYADSGKTGIGAQMGTVGDDALKNISLSTHKKPLTLWIGQSQNIAQSGLFVDLPEKLKPSPLNLIFKDLTGTRPTFKREDFFFELLDFDAF